MQSGLILKLTYILLNNLISESNTNKNKYY